MYFAVDPADTEQIVTAIERAFAVEATKNAPGLQVLALVDTAFDAGRQPMNWPLVPVALYARDELEALRNVSPILLALAAPGSLQFDAQLRELIRHCSGRPMLGFVLSTQSPVTLRDEWHGLHKLWTGDQQRLLLRIADTRITELISTVMDIAYWAALHRPVEQWWVINRQGKAQRLAPSQGPGSSLNQPGSPSLDAQRLAALLYAGEADCILDQIYQALPDLLPPASAESHRMVHEVCLLAERCGVGSPVDRFALAIANFADPGFLTRDGLIELLMGHAWVDGHLIEMLQALDDQVQMPCRS